MNQFSEDSSLNYKLEQRELYLNYTTQKHHEVLKKINIFERENKDKPLPSLLLYQSIKYDGIQHDLFNWTIR